MAGAVVEGNVESILDELSYGPVADGEAAARAWLQTFQSRFGYFIDGKRVMPDGRNTSVCKKPATGEVLANFLEATDDDINSAVEAAGAAFDNWSKVGPHGRARHIYSIARNLQKHQSLLAVVEAMDTGKPTRETRGVDVPAAIRQFYHHAGWAQLMDVEMAGWKPHGVTAVFPHWTFPLMGLASQVAPALATGNTVIIMPSPHTVLSALLFADICMQAGLPGGVINVVTGSTQETLYAHPNVDKVVFSGSVNEARNVRQRTSGIGKSLTLAMSARCPVLVFEDADLDSAVEGIIDAAFFNSGQSRYAGSKLLVQETVYEALIKMLKSRMSKLTVGDNMDKNNDQGLPTHPDVAEQFEQLVKQAEDEGAEVFRTDSKSSFCPTLLTSVQTSSPIYLEEVYGPLVVAVPFRTLKEGITIANHSVFGTAAGVWSENVNIALEAAALLKAGTVWVNSHNLFDAAAGVGGCQSSAYGQLGGKEGLYEFMMPSWQTRWTTELVSVDMKKFGTAASNSDPLPDKPISQSSGGGDVPSIDKTLKLFYGGGQKRPDSGASRPVLGHDGKILGHVPDGGKKDIRNAVEEALKGAAGWGKKDGHGRAQVMYYMAENLQSRREEFARCLSTMTGQSNEDTLKEVDTAIERLFYWAAYCDKYGGSVQETTMYGMTIKRHEPVGVIGIVCPYEFPFLAFISLIAPAIARGNAVIAVPSEKYPLAGLAFHQVLETSDVPAGVVNIITGDTDTLTRCLAEHHDVSSMWHFASKMGCSFVEAASAGNFKRTWVNHGSKRNFMIPEQGQGEEFLYHATACKNIWLPMGDIFAN